MKKELERIELSLDMLKSFIQPTIYKGLKDDIKKVKNELNKIIDYDTQQQTQSTEYEQLQRDVQRYFELKHSQFWVDDKYGNRIWGFANDDDKLEYEELEEKLKKVSK